MIPDIQIDRLRLSLPPQWRGKEQLVARALARELSNLRVPQSVTLATLHVPPLTIQGGEAFPAVIRRVGRQVQAQLDSVAADSIPSPRTPSPHA